MAGSVLWLLQDSLRVEFFDGGTDLFGLMADHGNEALGLQRGAATNYVLNESTPAGGVQHFCERRFEPRALSCGQDHDHHIFVRHSAAILSRPSLFDNRRA